MSQIEKLYNKISRRPIPSDIMFDEIDKLLKYYGFRQRENSGGSHFVYTHTAMGNYKITIVKHGGHVKKGYVKETKKAIDTIKEILI